MATPESAVKVVCYGPWRAATLLFQPRPGEWTLTIACHSVFELAPRESKVIPKAPPLDSVTTDDERAFVEPWGPTAPFKGSPEVIVVGHAHAAPGSNVTSLVVRLAVGADLEKLLHVHGDAWFNSDGALSASLPFSKMPLRWDRAAGGPHESNPAGIVMGKGAMADAQGRIQVPNLRPMGTWLTRRDDVFPPVGFGPIRPGWPSRVERLQHHAAHWDPPRWMERPLPADLDASYFNVAPVDQTLPTLAGDERIHLEHLSARFPKLTTHLAATPPCVVASLGGAERNVPVVCDTLVIDSDRDLAFLVWRGQLSLSHPQQTGMVFVSPTRLGESATGTMVGTMVGSLGAGTPALPFQRGGGAAGTLPGTSAPAKPALPFQAKRDAAPSPEITGETSPPSDTDEEEGDPPTLRRAALEKLFAAKGDTLPPGALQLPLSVDSSIERCATIAARLASPGADRAAILEAEGLSAEAWDEEHTRWLGKIQDELDRGNRKLLQLVRAQQRVVEEQVVVVIEQHQSLLLAYDAAYVTALEERRGPLTAADFARLSRAAEKGQAAPVLAELSLPETALTRIQRVWRAKISKDSAIAAAVHAALQPSKT